MNPIEKILGKKIVVDLTSINKSFDFKDKWCKCENTKNYDYKKQLHMDENCPCGLKKLHSHCPKCGGWTEV